jgi:hypothetical protein
MYTDTGTCFHPPCLVRACVPLPCPAAVPCCLAHPTAAFALPCPYERGICRLNMLIGIGLQCVKVLSKVNRNGLTEYRCGGGICQGEGEGGDGAAAAQQAQHQNLSTDHSSPRQCEVALAVYRRTQPTKPSKTACKPGLDFVPGRFVPQNPLGRPMLSASGSAARIVRASTIRSCLRPGVAVQRSRCGRKRSAPGAARGTSTCRKAYRRMGGRLR